MAKLSASIFAVFALRLLSVEAATAQATPEKPLMSQTEVQRLIKNPAVLAERLVPNSQVAFYRTKSELIGGPMWEPAVTFWTRPHRVVPSGLDAAVLCSSQTLTVPLWRETTSGLKTVYGVVDGTETSQQRDPCASSDPEQFFTAVDADIAAQAIVALHDLLLISPSEEVDRVTKSCVDEDAADRFCGLWAGSLTAIYAVERTDCKRTFYIFQDGEMKKRTEREGGLAANDCYILYEGSLYFTRKVVIEIGPAKPKAFIEQSQSVM